MKKKLYLHIGFHKTGTSALQEIFDINRNNLLKKGIYYPKSFNNQYPGHADLSWALNYCPPKWSKVDTSDVLKYYDRLINKPNVNFDSLLISSEDFLLIDNNEENIKVIRDFFKNYDTTVIVYVREPKEFILSLYSHAIRARAINCSFKEYIAKKYDFGAADYTFRLRFWKKIFKNKLIVKKYDKKSFKNHNLIDDFLDILGKDTTGLIDLKRKSNVGIHPWLLEAYRNAANIDSNSKNIIEQKLIELSSLLPKENAINYLLDSDDVALIDNIYKKANRILFNEYGIKWD